MSLFLPITKIDLARRLVYGTISEEVPDRAGEVLDYESSKPAFEEWSRQFQEASGGKSFGNVRAMHGAVAAGKFTGLHFDDGAKRIEGVAHIVDDDEWCKVAEGVYTGFSIGGGYARRWPDGQNPKLMRYTPVLCEVSLVDNPAVPTATFQVIKNDGSVELRKFNTEDSSSQCAQLLAGLAWLEDHALAIGANGLLAHIKALQDYLNEEDEAEYTDEMPASKLHRQIEELKKRIADLEAQPLPAKGVLRVVSKRDDRAGSDEKQVVVASTDRVREMMKQALANPILV